MKILFLSNAHLNCNTGWHIASLAKSLSEIGASCVVCVPTKEDTSPPDVNAFLSIIHADHVVNSIADDLPDLIYVWTPREGNRKTLNRILEKYKIPYFVHFEDNEFHLTKTAFRMSEAEFAEWTSRDVPSISVPNQLTDPSAMRHVTENATGITALVNELLNIVPRSVPGIVFWPGYDESLSWGMPPDLSFKRQVGIPDGEFVVAYTGNLHPANAGEIRSLYLAVALLNRRGIRVRLVRTGEDYAPLTDHGESLLRKSSIELGLVPRADLPRLLSISDVLVQPGSPDDFNIYRFPSKIPEFLASGKPVVLPACNIGAYLENEHEAIVLAKCNALEIARTLEKLLPDTARRQRIGSAGAAFAFQHLRWSSAAARLLPFFRQAIARDDSGPGDVRLTPLRTAPPVLFNGLEKAS
jgi:glycosyltransferase involved in cell wall biosynthesis